MAHAYPLLLDVSDRLVVIIGGGAVAVRKAGGLIDAGATHVRVVAPTIDPRMPPAVERVVGTYEPKHLDGALLAFAATDDSAVNDAVVRDCRRLGILVNRADADDDAPGDFSTPAVLRDGAVAIMVSAGGSPALAAAIRDDLRARLDPGHVAMAGAMQSLRPIVRGTADLDIKQRKEIFRDLASQDAISTLLAGGMPALGRWLAGRYPVLDKHLNQP